MLWQSDEIPGGGDGGYGSVVVSGGRAFVYVNEKYRVAFPHRVLTAEAVRQLGGEALDLPADLLAKVEQARLSKRRTALAGEELRDWLRQWSAKHFGSEADRRGAPDQGPCRSVLKGD